MNYILFSHQICLSNKITMMPNDSAPETYSAKWSMGGLSPKSRRASNGSLWFWLGEDELSSFVSHFNHIAAFVTRPQPQELPGCHTGVEALRRQGTDCAQLVVRGVVDGGSCPLN